MGSAKQWKKQVLGCRESLAFSARGHEGMLPTVVADGSQVFHGYHCIA